MGIDSAEYEKIFLWMPTYRKSRDGYIQDTEESCEEIGGLPLFADVEELGELNRFLEQPELSFDFENASGPGFEQTESKDTAVSAHLFFDQ